MTAIAICLAVVLTVPLLAFAMIFAVGCCCGIAAYHLSRQVVVTYQPMRKAFDPQKEKTKEIAVARKLAQEITELQTAHLSGLQMTREQYLEGNGQ